MENIEEVWKRRFSKLTYNLIYPAFIGNMIYDLLLRKLAWSNDNLTSYNFWICLTIIFYLLFDFMHLQSDMEKIVSESNKKTWKYILIDILTSFLIFFSFVFFKESNNIVGLSLFTFIPIGILYYKWKNKKARNYFLIYSIISFVFFVVLIMNSKNQNFMVFVLINVVLSTLIYFYFISFYYIQKCEKEDLNIMEKQNSMY
jgi:hypothetical protein